MKPLKENRSRRRATVRERAAEADTRPARPGERVSPATITPGGAGNRGGGREVARREAVGEGGLTGARAPLAAAGPSSLPSPSAPPGRRTCSLSAAPAASPAAPAPPRPAARRPPSSGQARLERKGKEGRRQPPPGNNREPHWKDETTTPPKEPPLRLA